MAAITFKAKPYQRQFFLNNGDLAEGRKTAVNIPKIKHNHCDMHAFRIHKRYGSFANSNMFLSMVARALKPLGTWIDCDSPPDDVTVDQSGFLTIVSIDI